MKRLVGTGISETELACNDQLSSYTQVELAKPEPKPNPKPNPEPNPKPKPNPSPNPNPNPNRAP